MLVRWGASVAAAVIGLVAAPGCASSTAPPAKGLALSACTVDGGTARCGRFAVPENPSEPGGRTIQLRIVVLPATTSDRAADPLFYLEGGPGGSAVAEASWVRAHFGFFNRRHDIVLVDQRGTGGSNLTTCASPAALGAATDLAGAVATCLASVRGRADPAYYTTPLAVDDFDAVRAALGYDRIDVYGVSYGVSSGLAYVQRHGAHVRAALFDSGSMLDYHILESVPRSAQQSLMLLFDRCRADATCDAAYPRLREEFDTVTASLARTPVVTSLVEPVSGAYVTIDVNAFMNIVLSGYLAWTQTAANLPRDVHAAAKGDWSRITATLKGMMGGDDAISVMSLTVRCSDEWASHDSVRAAATAPASPFSAYEAQFLSEFSAVCGYWPAAAGAGGRVKSSAPIVFLNSTGDPVDPPDNVAAAKADMPNSLVVPVQGAGHWQLDGDQTHCLDLATAEFLESGRPSSLERWPCAATPSLPAFSVA